MKRVFFDLETTGLDPSTCAVLEVGLVCGNLSWGSLLNPGPEAFADGRADKALAVNHIQLEDVQAAEDTREVWGAFVRTLMLLDGGEQLELVAWNVDFDRGFLLADPYLSGALKRLGVTFRCAMLRHKRRPGATGRNTLAAAAECWGVQLDTTQTHRAVYDAQALADVWAAMDAAGVPL